MGTKIEWANETWNPTTGCTKVSPGCARLDEPAKSALLPVVAGDELPRPPAFVEQAKCFAASTRTNRERIRLARQSASEVLYSMRRPVVVVRRHDLKILGPVVKSVAVDVVNDLAAFEASSERVLRNDAMLVDIAAHVGKMMLGHPDERISRRRNRAPASPVITASHHWPHYSTPVVEATV